MPASHYCARCLTTFPGDPGACPNLGCGGERPPVGWGVVLGPGDLLDRTYRIVRGLAVGGAGITYLARELDPDGQEIDLDLAIKVLYTTRDAGPFLRRLSTEAQILQELDHPHIVQCRGFVQRRGHAPYLVTRFEPGGSLSNLVERAGPLPPRVACGILRQVLLALDVAHQRGVVHRDLKPDNVLLSTTVGPGQVPFVRVADFGIAKVEGSVGQRLTRFGAFVGTPEYAAPEQFEGLAPTPATDLFAAGGLITYLVTGRTPVTFKHREDIAQSFEELLDQLDTCLPSTVVPATERAVLDEVIRQTRAREPGDRWTIHQVLTRFAALAEPPVRPSPAPTTQPIRLQGGQGTLHTAERSVDTPASTFAVGPDEVSARRPATLASAADHAAAPRPVVDPAPRPEGSPAGAALGVAGLVVAGVVSGVLVIGALGVAAIAFGYGAPPSRWMAPVDVAPVVLRPP